MNAYRATHLIFEPAGPHRCFYCSAPADQPLKLSGTFTEWWAVDQPESQHVCSGCLESMNEKRELPGYEKKQKTRNFSWLVTRDGMWHMTKGDKSKIIDVLLSPPDPPWAFALAESGQKQILYRTPVNHGDEPWTVQLELEQVTYDRQLLRDRVSLARRVVAAVGHKGAVAPGINMAITGDADLFDRWVDVLNEPLTRLALFVCPSQKECQNHGSETVDAGTVQAGVGGDSGPDPPSGFLF